MNEEAPALFRIEIREPAPGLWCVLVYRRADGGLAFATRDHAGKQAALAEAKLWMAPYSAGLTALP